MKRMLLYLLIGLTGWCCTSRNKVDLRIAAASSLKPVLEQLIKTYEEQTGIKIELSLASTGKLYNMIHHKAPFDLFLAADMMRPKTLYQKNFGSKPIPFAKGSLVSITSKKELDANPGDWVKDQDWKIAIANPETAPYGEAAMQYLRDHKLYSALKDRLVFGENVQQVNQFLLSGAVDGILTSSSAIQNIKGRPFRQLGTSDKLLHGGIIISKTNKWADKFLEFLVSEKASQHWKTHGYESP